MARLPGRVPERPLSVRSALFLLVLLGSGAPLRAQEAPAAPDVGAPEAALEIGLRLTHIERSAIWMPGAVVQVRLGSRLRVGGAGWVMTGSVPLQGGAGVGRDLEVGYGGASLSLDLPLSSPSASLVGRLLLGAGNGDVRTRASGALVGSDNFGVVEAEIDVAAPLRRGISFVGGAGWRAVFGVDDLPGVSGRDISGPSVMIGLRLSAL